MGARLIALISLALALLKTLLARVGAKSALPQFNEHYGTEGIVGLTHQESAVLSHAGRCTACGRCDAEEGPRVASSTTGYAGMMHFALSGCRSLPNYDATARTIIDVPDEVFIRGGQLCPEGVPLLELAQLVRGHAARRARALPKS